MIITSKIKRFVSEEEKCVSELSENTLNENKLVETISFEAKEYSDAYTTLNSESILLDYHLNKNNPEALNCIETLKHIKLLFPDARVKVVS